MSVTDLHVIKNSFSFTTSDSHSRELCEIVNSKSHNNGINEIIIVEYSAIL